MKGRQTHNTECARRSYLRRPADRLNFHPTFAAKFTRLIYREKVSDMSVMWGNWQLMQNSLQGANKMNFATRQSRGERGPRGPPRQSFLKYSSSGKVARLVIYLTTPTFITSD